MLPPAMSVVIQEKFRLNKKFDRTEALSENAGKLLAEMQKAADERQLMTIAKSAKRSILNELTENGAIESDNAFKQNVGDASIQMVRLSKEYLEFPEKFKLTPKQKKTADFLEECGSASVRELAYMCGVTTAVVKRLAANGAAEEYTSEVLRTVDLAGIRETQSRKILFFPTNSKKLTMRFCQDCLRKKREYFSSTESPEAEKLRYLKNLFTTL